MNTDSREHWEPLVGRFILSCGDVELRLLQLHWNLSIGGSYNGKLRNRGMGGKAKAILVQVQESDLRPELKKKTSHILNETINLAHSRNLVAHNPLYLDIYSDAEGNFQNTLNIRSLRDMEKHISLESLTSLIEEAMRLESELIGLLNEVVPGT